MRARVMMLLACALLAVLVAPSQARGLPRRAPPILPQLRLRGAGWLASSSESAETGELAASLSAEDSSGDSGPVNSKYTLSATGLLDPAQYNATDDVLDLFLRPPPRPTTRDGTYSQKSPSTDSYMVNVLGH
jgi:hypothetical protein